MGSRMSNQSFDRMSGSYSNRSGSRGYNNSRSSRPNPIPDGSMNLSKDISYIKPLATSQPVNSVPQNNFLNYFAQDRSQDEAVDVDDAINAPEMGEISAPDAPEITFSALPETSYMEVCVLDRIQLCRTNFPHIKSVEY